ncbi:TetR family transcriptional regulator [Nocardia sp. CDC159]|uniref:TetR family transcriptional regulator n=1 Tax=Nocardia pulmonis TaxID=2951408 RepID=A0A9X2IXK7_9NOCA|nr:MULTISPECIES: TetR family transcriptional regulator [Nocardia]MCM6775493.1 TetR family transcriptional regulator [Nocardia pulmonis]MCM6787773.1 TetR family transcriptional regulator [Nocardia sp. CDC159]
MADEPNLGLRERKKRDTRRALSDAALELAFERGFENVTREDIAARAGVSVRTFSNYFANKWQALTYRQTDRMHRTIELLRERPADEPMWEAVSAAVLTPLEAEIEAGGYGPPTREQLGAIRKLLVETPEARAAMALGPLDDLVAVIAERSGTDPGRDLYPRLVAGMVVAVFQSSFETYIRSDPPVPITTVLRRALSLVGSGMSAPGAATGH